jgi:hypothetical protein
MVAYITFFQKPYVRGLSRHLWIPRIAMSAFFAPYYCAKPSTATGFLSPTTGRSRMPTGLQSHLPPGPPPLSRRREPAPITLVTFRRFLGMGHADSRLLRCDSFVRMQHFVPRSTTYVPFRRCLGDVRREFICNVSPVLFMVLWIPVFAMLCMRAVPML